MAQGISIYIDDKDKFEASVAANTYTNADTKNRAYMNTLGAELVMKYLNSEHVEIPDKFNLHSIKKILEEFDIADIFLKGLFIDVRVIFDDNIIFIPKSHFDYNLTPDVYLVLQISKNSTNADFLGFFEPQTINTQNANKDYYFINKDELSAPDEFINYVKAHNKSLGKGLSDDALEDSERIIISFIDNDVSISDKKTLLKNLTKSAELREKFIEYENFETLSFQAMFEPTVEKGEIVQDVFIQDEFEMFDQQEAQADIENLMTEDEATDDNPSEFNLDGIVPITVANPTENADAAIDAISEVTDEVMPEIVETLDTSENMENVDIVEPLETSESVEPIDIVETMESSEEEPIDKLENIETLDEVEPVAVEENIETLDEVEPVEVEENIETLDEVEPIEVEEHIETLDEVEPVEVEENIETLDEVEPVVVEENIETLDEVEPVAVEENIETLDEVEPVTVEENIETLDEVEPVVVEENIETLDEIEPVTVEENIETLDEIEPVVVEENIETLDEVEPVELTEASENIDVTDDKAVENVNIQDNLPIDGLSFDDIKEFEAEPIAPIIEETVSMETLENSVSGINIGNVDNIEDVSTNDSLGNVDNIEYEQHTFDDLNDNDSDVQESTSFGKNLIDNLNYNEIQNDTNSVSDEVQNIEPEIQNQEQETEFNEQQRTSTSDNEEINFSDMPEKDKLNVLYTQDETDSEIEFVDESELSDIEQAENNNGLQKYVKYFQNYKKQILTAALFIAIISIGYFTVLKPKATDDFTAQNEITDSMPDAQNVQPGTNTEENILTTNTPKVPETPKVEVTEQKPVQELKNTPSQPKPKAAASYLDVSKIVWDVPDNLSQNPDVRNYLRTAGKSIKVSLSTDLLLANEYAYSNFVKVGLNIGQTGNVISSKILTSSGSAEIDNIVLQSVKDTLNTVKPRSSAIQSPNFNLGIIIYF